MFLVIFYHTVSYGFYMFQAQITPNIVNFSLNKGFEEAYLESNGRYNE